MKRVLIAVDDGPTAEKVALEGLQLAKQLNAEIALVSVVDTTFPLTDGGVTPKELIETVKKNFKKIQQILIKNVFKDRKVWNFVEEASLHEGVLKVAEEWQADVIVLGTHGRTGLQHLLMGSVAEKIIRHSTKPLYIIPTRQD